MRTLTPRAEALLVRLADASEVAARIFLTQWDEIRGRWEEEDWFDRIVHHTRFLEANTWDGIRWHGKED